MDNVTPMRVLVDQVAIRQLLATHSRGIDRTDTALLDQVWDESGHVAYGFFTGKPREFSATVTGLMRGGPITLHRTSNMWIKVRGDEAVSESYVLAYTVTDDDGAPPVQTLIGGRYLDQFKRHHAGWRMTHRQYLMEWNVNWEGTGSTLPGFSSAFGPMGGHVDADPSVEFFKQPAPSSSGDLSMHNTDQLLTQVDVALSKLAIHELIMAQARAADRRDAALLKSVWHDDATVDVGFFNGSISGYPEALFAATAGLFRVYHSIANEWVEVQGETAVAESYVIAFTTTPTPTGGSDALVGGRYLDRFERRNGIWKCSHRQFVMDWSMDQPASDRSDAGMLSMLPSGGRFPDDPVYPLWASLK